MVITTQTVLFFFVCLFFVFFYSKIYKRTLEFLRNKQKYFHTYKDALASSIFQLTFKLYYYIF